MTYGIPYAFVPGTKAKADEVNANFNYLIEQLEDQNSDITTKAEATDIDGQWQFKSLVLATNVSLNNSGSSTYDLSSYLPDDGNRYEVLLMGNATTDATNNAYAPLYVASDLVCPPNSGTVTVAISRTRTTASNVTGGNCIIIVGGNRTLSVSRNTNWNGTFSLELRAYRKVR